MARLPMVIPADMEALHPDVPSGLLDETFRHACERLDAYVGALALELAAELELPAGRALNLDALFASRRWSERGRLAVAWVLDTLTLYGEAAREAGGWRLAGGAPQVSSSEQRTQAERVMPSARPAYQVLALSAEALPAVLRGELRGEEALFGPATLGLWFQYFSNANPHYAPNNVIAGVAVARAAPARASVFEFGGGAGSAAEAVLAALGSAGKPAARYVFTELQPAFLRRGGRAVQQVLPAGCEYRSLRFDINLDPAGQGVEPGQFDVVFGVNTAHLAHDVMQTLANLRALLKPSGVLVLGELLRPSADAAVHLELPFTLLEEYGRAPLLEGIRPRPGFMSTHVWVRALEAAGFNRIGVLPAQIARCAEIYPGFYCGAITAHA
jgi:SAM-dependent methyltransferase